MIFSSKLLRVVVVVSILTTSVGFSQSAHGQESSTPSPESSTTVVLNTTDANPATPNPTKNELLTTLKKFGVPADLNSAELKRGSCILRELYLSKDKAMVRLSEDEIKTLNSLSNKDLIFKDGVYISITCQYGYFIKENKVLRIFRASTGRPGMDTKVGEFKIYYQYNGWWESTIYPGSMMYRPKYFYKNMALHGLKSDSSVKPYPASHGCVRVTKSTMDFLWKNLSKNTMIKIYK